MKRLSSNKGFSVFELIASLGIAAVMMAMAFSDLRSLENPVTTSAQQLTGFLKQVRAKAIATTSAYKITPVSVTELETSYATHCDADEDDWEEDINLRFDFPRGAFATDTSWELCITSRGLPEDDATLSITGDNFHYSSVEMMLGGAVRVSY